MQRIRVALLWSLPMIAASVMCTTAIARETAQSKSCYQKAAMQHLHGAARASFHRACVKGALSPSRPTETNSTSKEAKAITEPSGVDRTVRSKQCSAEADKRGLKDKDREAFRLSCLATAGPTTEASTHAHAPAPAKAIPGIGVNNYKPK